MLSYFKKSEIDDEKIYSELFYRFLRHTDSKDNFINIFQTLFPSTSNLTGLDVGCGVGNITGQLGKGFRFATGIEPNGYLLSQSNLHKSENVNYVRKKLESYQSDDKYDIIIVSYFFDTLNVSEYGINLQSLEHLLSDDGRILGVSFLPNSKWDQYLEAVAESLGIERKGGAIQVNKRLAHFGWQMNIIACWRSFVIGETVEQLYDTMVFFVRKKAYEYITGRSELLETLEAFSRGNSCQKLEMYEVIYECRPTQTARLI